jgi:hypothetical protein
MRVTSAVIRNPYTYLLTKLKFSTPHHGAIFAEELPRTMHLSVFEFTRVSRVPVIVKRIAQLKPSQTFRLNPAGQWLQQLGQP